MYNDESGNFPGALSLATGVLYAFGKAMLKAAIYVTIGGLVIGGSISAGKAMANSRSKSKTKKKTKSKTKTKTAVAAKVKTSTKNLRIIINHVQRPILHKILEMLYAVKD